MSGFNKLAKSISDTGSHLCVGLDPADGDVDRMRYIIKETHGYACAYKMNLAFYLGQDLEEVVDLFKWDMGDRPLILDAKWGDIENTADKYAYYAFITLNVDGVTINPYMGSDSIKAFSKYSDKFMFSLAYTSNPSSSIQRKMLDNGLDIGEEYATEAYHCGIDNNVGLVAGANPYKSYIHNVRREFPDAWILVPGVGPQGGVLSTAVKGASSGSDRFIINAGRSILEAASPRDMAMSYRDLINSYKETSSDSK
jgi:orotidine 5'-phosphate decarboxylase subfamily 2